ncbi:hypothetical protein, partial [uncultured Delftia sp.]
LDTVAGDNGIVSGVVNTVVGDNGIVSGLLGGGSSGGGLLGGLLGGSSGGGLLGGLLGGTSQAATASAAELDPIATSISSHASSTADAAASVLTQQLHHNALL